MGVQDQTKTDGSVDKYKARLSRKAFGKGMAWIILTLIALLLISLLFEFYCVWQFRVDGSYANWIFKMPSLTTTLNRRCTCDSYLISPILLTLKSYADLQMPYTA